VKDDDGGGYVLIRRESYMYTQSCPRKNDVVNTIRFYKMIFAAAVCRRIHCFGLMEPSSSIVLVGSNCTSPS
jgi:hypothetical protein